MVQHDANERLDDALGALIVRDRWPSRLLDTLSLLGDIPTLGSIIKPMVIAGGWWLDDRKPDRVFPALVAIKDKFHEAERRQSEYIRKEEFKDLFEETIRRIADEPDPDRREWLKNVLLRVMDEPKDHAENRLFLRLLEELSTDAHKLLAILDQPITTTERQLEQDAILAGKAGIRRDRAAEAKEELARLGLIDRQRFVGPDPSSKKLMPGNPLDAAGGLQFERPDTHGSDSYSYFYTRLGREFIAYRRGTDAS